MAYIGAEPLPGQNREVDDISSSFNGSTTAFTLQVNGVNVSPESANNILVNIGGVIQNPGTDYTIAASTITFTTAPASGLSFFAIILGAGINTATVADGTIGTAKVVDNSITADKLAHTSVTAGSYTTADITVDAQGRITAAASGSISGAEIADQAVTNAKVNNSAAIAGTKISPDFGSQNIVTTGSISGAAGTFTGDVSIPANIVHTGDTHTAMRFTGNDSIAFDTGGTSRVQITDSTTDVGNDLSIADKVIHTGDTNTAIRFPAADTISFETAGTERIRIGSTGNVGIKTTSTANPLVIQNMVNSRVHFRAIGDISSTVAGAGLGLDVLNDGASAVMDLAMRGATIFFRNATSESARFSTTGMFGINNTSPAYRLDVQHAGSNAANAAVSRFRQTTNNTGDDHTCFIVRHAGARSGQNGVGLLFQNDGGTAVGKIDFGQSTTQYRTTSDYRLKENEVAISDGITRLKTLKPYRFNFITEPDKTVDGFFAHEVTAVPEAISGTKDEVETTYYEEGDTIPDGKAVGDVKSTTSPVYQGIDQSKLVPLLTAALQEAITKIETLETKVAALESA